MPSDNDQPEAASAGLVARTPDRLCPSNYHSYRRHSSPSALGESAAFEFPESSTDTPRSPEEDSPKPIRHGGLTNHNHSSPFLTRGNIRTRAQSSSSDFVSVEIVQNKAYTETNSFFSSSPDEDIFSDVKFELQAPPKHRSKRSRAHTSSGSLTQTKDLISDTTRLPSGNTSVQAQVDKTRRKTINADDNDLISQNDDVFYQKAKTHRRRSSPGRRRGPSPDTPPVSCLGVIGDSVSQSPEINHDRHSTRRPSSPCRLYKIVKDAEDRVSSLKSQRRPSPPKPVSYPPPKSPVSPLSSPRSPLSPSANTVSAGVVVTSSRPSRRRSSISSAASAFAAATAGASPSHGATSPTRFRFGEWT